VDSPGVAAAAAHEAVALAAGAGGADPRSPLIRISDELLAATHPEDFHDH
jgi:hypothetical protein